MILESPAHLEPDLCALEEWDTFRGPLVQLIATGLGQRQAIVCGLSETARRRLDKDLRAYLGETSSVSGLQIFSRESDLDLARLPGLLVERVESIDADDPPGIYFVHDLGWAIGRYSVEEIQAYQQQMAVLRRDHPLQMVHLYPPGRFNPEAQWRLMRGHRAVWTGESACENFYYSPRPQAARDGDFDYADDLRRHLDHLRRQSRIRAELVGTVVQTESLMEERVRELQALNRLAQILAHSQDLDEILHEALVRVIELLEMGAGAIYIRKDASLALERRVVLPSGEFSQELLTRFHEHVIGATPVLQSGRIAWASDLRESPAPEIASSLGVRSYLAAPLKFSGGVVGVLEVVGDEAHPFSLQEIHMVDVIGGQIGVAVENARLYHQHLESETAEQRLREQLVHTEKLASLGHLVSRIAQEVATPLSSALQAAARLEKDSRSGPTRDRLRAVMAEMQRAERVLTNLRTLVGEHRGERVPVRLNELVRNSVRAREAALRARGIEVAARLAEHLPEVLADAGQIEQVLSHLVDNAEYALATWPGDRRLEVATAAHDTHVVLTVRNEGPAIVEDLGRIFEPFVRGHDGPGAGLGLAICRAIVQSHGGAITAESGSGHPTTFTVKLPALSQESPRATVASGPRKGARKR